MKERITMEKQYDTFDYEIKRVTYSHSYTSGDDILRCVFMINGEDILEIVRKALTGSGDFHHTTLEDLWAFDLDDDPYKPGRIHLLICSCDELGCDNISVRVTENENSIIWDSFRSECDDSEDLKLSFEFEKGDYNQKMEQLKVLARASCMR